LCVKWLGSPRCSLENGMWRESCGVAAKMKGMLEADAALRKCHVICMIRWTRPWRHISYWSMSQYAPKLWHNSA
jgi:hypothetical protein